MASMGRPRLFDKPYTPKIDPVCFLQDIVFQERAAMISFFQSPAPCRTRVSNVLLLLAIALLSAASASAEAKPEVSIPAAPALHLADLIKEAETNNPEIQAALSKYEAARARPSQERTLPDPMIGFMATNMNNPVPFSSIGRDPQSNAGVNISQEIPFPGKLSLKGEIAQKESQSEFQEYQAVRLLVLSKLKSTFHDYSFFTKRAGVLTKSKKALDELVQVAESRYKTGSGNQQDVLRAQVEASIIEARLLAVGQKKQSAMAQLNALLNRPPETHLDEPEILAKSTLTSSYEQLLELAARNSPMLKARQELVARDQLNLDLSHRQYYPDVTLGAYYGNSGDLPEMWQLRVDFKVPLYFATKQDYGVVESMHNLSRAQRENEATQQNINFSLKDDYAQAKASESLLQLYSTKTVPDAKMAFESSLRSYETGQVDFLTLITNLVTARDFEIGYAEELANFEKALARIEAMTGEPVT